MTRQQQIKPQQHVQATELNSAEHLHAIIETSIEGIISIDDSGIVQSFNPAAEKMFDYAANEVIGNNISMLMPSPYQREHDSYIKRYLTSGEPKIIGIGRELEGKRKNGTNFPIWLAIAEFFVGERRFFTGFIRDLSEERAYFERASNYEHILENSLNEIYIFDTESLKFIRVNQGALANLQYTAEEIVELTPLDLKPEYTQESFEELIRPLWLGERNKIHFTTVHIRKDRSLYPVDVHLELYEFGAKKAFVAIILDITEKIEAQEKLKIQQEQLAHMDRLSMMGEMAAGIAHEINQPLTAIDSYAQAAKRRIQTDSIDTDKLQELLEKISKTSVRAGEVITQLRALVKRQPKSRNNVDINSIIRDTAKIAEVDTQALNFEIDLDLGNELPNVVVDSVQIQQVILNLIRNAMDAAVKETNKYKIIFISTTLLEEENRIKVSVKDNGCGIDEDSAEQLFNPFYSTKKSGMGMGLSICQTIIHEHGGRLWFTRNTDKGTTFHLTLPTALNDEKD